MTPADNEIAAEAASSLLKIGGASFLDLWRANATVLARCFPAQDGVRQYDASAADHALALHLVIQSACDVTIERLMRHSALARPKYNHSEYLPYVIKCAKRFTQPGGLQPQESAT